MGPGVRTRRELGENPTQPPVQQMEKLGFREGEDLLEVAASERASDSGPDALSTVPEFFPRPPFIHYYAYF